MTTAVEPPHYSVVVPVFRAGETLLELAKRLNDLFDGLGHAHELVLVEDCGGDHSWQVITELAARDPRVRGIRLSRNYGQHNALLCGIRSARGEVVITLDDDLQHPPEELPVLLQKFGEGHDVVYGAPLAQTHGLFRNFASQVTKWVLSGAMGAETAGQVSAWRVFRTSLREAFADYRSPYVNIDVMLTWGTSRFAYVRVRHEARARGRSGYTLRTLARHAMNMVTGFSNLPLQLASMMGFAFAGFGMLVLAYVTGRYLLVGSAVPGFAFLASIISIFSGGQLLALGIMGEYLSRIHFRTMGRPPYYVGEEVQ